MVDWGMVWHGQVGYGSVRRGRECNYKTKVRCGQVRSGEAGHGVVRYGAARQGLTYVQERDKKKDS